MSWAAVVFGTLRVNVIRAMLHEYVSFEQNFFYYGQKETTKKFVIPNLYISATQGCLVFDSRA